MKIKLTYEQIDKVMVAEAKDQLLSIQPRITKTPGDISNPFEILDYTDAEEYLENVQLQRAYITILRQYMLWGEAESWLKENNIG